VLAAAAEADPDRRILKMLAARGSHVAAAPVLATGSEGIEPDEDEPTTP